MENPFKNLFGKKPAEPLLVSAVAGVQDMVYHKDKEGNHFYMFDGEYIKSNFMDLKMDTLAGKAQALQTVTPFAAMVDRMAKLFALGNDYVTDDENNENFDVEFYDRVRVLMERPNVFQTATMFKRQVETYLLVFGFCPIFGFRLSKNDIPVALWCIPPNLFHAKMSGDFLMQTDYKDIVDEAYIQLGTRRMKLEPEDYFIVYSGQVEMGKEGEMTVRTPVDTLSVTLNNWINQAIARGAIVKDGGPMGMITNDDNSEFGNAAMSPKEEIRLNESFQAKYGLVGKRFKILVTQAALRWQPMSWNAGQLMLDQTRKATMEDICFTLGWSYGMFDPSSQYSNNAAGEEKRTYTTVIIPDSKAYGQALTDFLGQENLKYYIDYSDVEALQKDRKSEAETLNSVIGALNSALKVDGISMLEYRTALSEYLDIDPEDIPEKPILQLPPVQVIEQLPQPNVETTEKK